MSIVWSIIVSQVSHWGRLLEWLILALHIGVTGTEVEANPLPSWCNLQSHADMSSFIHFYITELAQKHGTNHKNFSSFPFINSYAIQ
jgi:hypothetical protein